MIICDTGDFSAIELTASDYARLAELVVTYGDLPLGTTDASVIAIAERLKLTWAWPALTGPPLSVKAGNSTFGDQLESLRFGDLEIRLRRKADEAASRGDLEAAEVLERAADIVGQRVKKTAAAYKSVRGGMPAGPERTAKMDAIIAEARTDAHAHDIDSEEVLSLLWTGSEGARVWALGILQERPELATPRAVLDAVQHPDEMFDQYHALVLADLVLRLPTTRAWTRERVFDAVRFQLQSGALGNDQPCRQLARKSSDRPHSIRR
jgi:hypothetical protein